MIGATGSFGASVPICRQLQCGAAERRSIKALRDSFVVCHWIGVHALKQQLTVVLPMYNSERHLRWSVMEVLDLAHSISSMIEVVVVDDGSTDETYETACELARTYPQVKVLRQPVRQGLSAALELVGRRLPAEMVVVHDGVTPVDSSQLKTLLQRDPQFDVSLRQRAIRETAAANSVGSRRFASARILHQSMEQASRHVTGFRWMQLAKPMVPRRRAMSVPIAMSMAPAGC